MARRRPSEPLLNSAFVAIATGLIEALLVWGVLGEPKLFGDVLFITAASLAVAQAGENVRYYGARPERLQVQRITLRAFVLTLIAFGAVVVLQSKRIAASPAALAGPVEYALLALAAVPSFGVRAYLLWAVL